MVNVPLAVAIFAATYVLVSARRLRWLPLGRPAAALAGAAAMVLVAGLPPEEAWKSLDHETLALLLGMMGLTAYLARDGFFDTVGAALETRCRSPVALLVGVGALAGVGSALLVNDAVCLFLTPVVVALCLRLGLPLPPFLLAVATCANVGSLATPVGNPQCMILAGLGGLEFRAFTARMAPVAAAGLAVNLILLVAYFGRSLRAAAAAAANAPSPAPAAAPAGPPRDARVSLFVTALVAAGFVAGLPLGWCAVGGFALRMILAREDPAPVLRRVDGGVLLFFAGLFVVVRGLSATGLPDRWWGAAGAPDMETWAGRLGLSGVLALGSNVVSNVPIVLVVAPRLAEFGGADGGGWYLAAMATTFAGNLTILGSVANIIVAEGAREHHELGFLEYLRFGAVSTAATLALGAWLV